MKEKFPSAELAVGKSGGIEKQKQERTKGKERRKQERFDCDGFAEVVVDDSAFLFRGNVQNVSLGGCYIHSHARLRIERGAEADLHFTLNGDFFHVRARMMIVRAGAGVGFEFISEDPDLQARIGRLIEKLSIAPSHQVVKQRPAAEEADKRSPARTLWDRAR